MRTRASWKDLEESHAALALKKPRRLRMRISTAVRLAVATLLAAGVASSAASVASAQAWPTKPVRMIVPFGPGGGTDIQARVLSTVFHEQTGQTFVVENRTGASGLIGAEIAANSPPDGYTILFSTASLTVNTTLYGNRMKVDPVNDLTPVSWL